MPETIEIQLKKGVLGLCVLALLNRADSYAYEIASRLSDAIGMGEGTIYPLMRRMQSDGQVETYLVESSSGPSRKYYRLTEAGRAALAALGNTAHGPETLIQAAYGALGAGQAGNTPTHGFRITPSTFFHSMPARYDAKGLVGIKWIGYTRR